MRCIAAIKPVEQALEKQATVDLSDVLGHEFYQMDKRGIPCEVDAEPPDHREFVRRVNELAYDIRNMLAMLGDEEGARPDPVAPSGRVVYVAETTSDLADDAERLRRALQQYGHTVLPQGRYAYGPDYAQNVEAGPVAIIKLPHRVRMTFHGMWVSQEALDNGRYSAVRNT